MLTFALMAGIYFHIPFCKQACHYCNFHFSTSLNRKSDMVSAILRELEMRPDYLNNEIIETIYFGGGTPSLLSRTELDLIFEKVYSIYKVSENVEITLEANPDDLNEEKLSTFVASPVNRLSIGVQSFFEEDLKFMNRAHNSEEALNCIKHAKNAGFDNLTIDLIYGSPTTSDENWRKNLDIIFNENIPHISCYCLTVEPKTALEHFVKSGKTKPVDENQAARQFEILIEEMEKRGYEHYEISNFALPNQYSRHNSNYWKSEKYIGIGPAAHSFDGTSRQWNVANNAKYMKAIESGVLDFEREILTEEQQYNEYILTALRTIWGSDLKKISSFGEEIKTHFIKTVSPFLVENLIIEKEENYTLSKKGKLLADKISMELFV